MRAGLQGSQAGGGGVLQQAATERNCFGGSAGPEDLRGRQQNKQGETSCLAWSRLFVDQKQVRAIKPLIAQQAGTNKLAVCANQSPAVSVGKSIPGVEKGLIATPCTRVKVQCQQETS